MPTAAEVDRLVEHIPGLEFNADSLDQAAANILAGKDPDIEGLELRREVAAVLRRRATALRLGSGGV
jgi:hypothetical protein